MVDEIRALRTFKRAAERLMGKGVVLPPLPPNCRNRVDSPRLQCNGVAHLRVKTPIESRQVMHRNGTSGQFVDGARRVFAARWALGFYADVCIGSEEIQVSRNIIGRLAFLHRPIGLGAFDLFQICQALVDVGRTATTTRREDPPNEFAKRHPTRINGRVTMVHAVAVMGTSSAS
jgi:hypothetical protein